MKQIEQNYRSKPLIVFAENLTDKIQEIIKEPVVLFEVKDKTSYYIARQKALLLDTGVIVCTKDFAIGADFRFEVDSEVYILSQDHLNREQIIQTLSRGQRAFGPLRGAVFTVDRATDNAGLKLAMQYATPKEMLSAATNLKKYAAFALKNSI